VCWMVLMGSCCMGSAEGWRVLLAVDAGEVEGYRIELIISIRKHGVCLATPHRHLHSWCCFPGWPLLPFYLCSMGHHQELTYWVCPGVCHCGVLICTYILVSVSDGLSGLGASEVFPSLLAYPWLHCIHRICGLSNAPLCWT